MTELRIVRSRRKTLALQVLPTGEIVARAPLRLPERDIHAFAEQHAAWLETAVARARAGSRAAQRAGILSEAELQLLRPREPELQLPSDAGPAGGTRVCRRA